MAEPPPFHQHQLAALSAAWDAHSDGHGRYWAGRAILEAGYASEAPRSLSLVRWVLDKWEALPATQWGSRVYQLREKEPRRERPRERPPTSERGASGERKRPAGASPRTVAHESLGSDGQPRIKIIGLPAHG